MAETTKTKIVNIQTGTAQKNVKTLRQQIKELKNEMAQLEKGTEAYNRTAKQLADLSQKQIEINEAAKYSNKDLGASLSSLTKVSSGVIGAINGINAVMAMMGGDSEEAQEALKTVQMTMAVIQSLGAIDTATKALDGLSNAFGGVGESVKLIDGAEEVYKETVNVTTGAIVGQTAATTANTGAKESEKVVTGELVNTEMELTEQKKLQMAAYVVTNEEEKKNIFLKLKARELLLNEAKDAKNAAKATEEVTKKTKSFGQALKSLGKAALPIAAIAAAVYGLIAAFKAIAKHQSDAQKAEEERLVLEHQLDAEYEKQKVDMDALLVMFKSENASAEQKEVLAKEINKLAGDELAIRNDITGEWEISNEKLEQYNKNLRTSIELEYHKTQIQELLAKEEEARNNAAYERTHRIGKLFKTENGYLEEANDLVAEQEKHWREIEKLTAGTVDNITQQNNKTKTTTRRGGGIVKTFKDIAIEVRDILLKSFAQLFDLKELKLRYNGVYTETEHLLLKINKIIESNDLSEKLTEQFKNALETGDLRNYGITFDYIFDKAKVDELVDKQVKAYEKFQKILEKKKGGSATDKEVQAQKAVVEELNKQIAAMKELADGVQAYADAWDKLEEKQRKHNQTDIQYNRELKTELEYMLKRSSGDINAETEKSVKLAELQLQIAEKQFKEDKQHLDLLRQKVEANQQNQKMYEDYLEYQEKVQQSQKDWYDARIALDNEYYNQRQERVKQFYDNYEKETEKAVKDISGINNFFRIMHFDDYNSEVIALETQRTAMDALEAQIEQYYNKQLEIHQNNAEMVELLQQEKNAALLQMSKEQADKEVEIEEAKVRRKIEIQRTYINLYQNLSSQISSLLSAEMSNYDENSTKYKKLKYAQGVTDTLSGTLSAFMSGIESGVPAPWNLGVAVAMAGITFATGLAQLKNIKNGSLSNSATASPINMEYDTLSYKNSVDILSAIQDQKVYVTETDITTTQNRVRVMESQSTF